MNPWIIAASSPGLPRLPDLRLGDDVLLGWIRRIHETSSWTTSVCTGSLLLGAAGLLDGLEATTHWSAVESLESFGAGSPGKAPHQARELLTAGLQ